MICSWRGALLSRLSMRSVRVGAPHRQTQAPGRGLHAIGGKGAHVVAKCVNRWAPHPAHAGACLGREWQGRGLGDRGCHRPHHYEAGRVLQHPPRLRAHVRKSLSLEIRGTRWRWKRSTRPRQGRPARWSWV